MALSADSLLKELKQIQKELDSLFDKQVILELGDEITTFKVILRPNAGYYEGGKFTFQFEVPSEYPFSPPNITCLTSTYHPNIYSSDVCLSILGSDFEDSLRLEHYINGLLYLFHNPNFDDMLNYVEFENKEEFKKLVQNVIEEQRQKDGEKIEVKPAVSEPGEKIENSNTTTVEHLHTNSIEEVFKPETLKSPEITKPETITLSPVNTEIVKINDVKTENVKDLTYMDDSEKSETILTYIEAPTTINSTNISHGEGEIPAAVIIRETKLDMNENVSEVIITTPKELPEKKDELLTLITPLEQGSDCTKALKMNFIQFISNGVAAMLNFNKYFTIDI